MRKILMALLLAGLTTACLEIDESSSFSEEAQQSAEQGGDGTLPTEGLEQANGDPIEPGSDQEIWDAISWHTAQGPSGRGARQVMTLDAEITSDGRFVQFSWDRYPWSGSGLGHFFVWDGTRWVGGKYEWISSPGQSTKTLDNIRNGYNQLSAPAPGSHVAFAWTNAQGTERSNLAYTTWQ